MYILIAILLGLICKDMAEKRNRAGTLGFIGGALFGLFSVIYYWAAGPKLDIPLKVDTSDSWASKINGEDK